MRWMRLIRQYFLHDGTIVECAPATGTYRANKPTGIRTLTKAQCAENMAVLCCIMPAKLGLDRAITPEGCFRIPVLIHLATRLRLLFRDTGLAPPLNPHLSDCQLRNWTMTSVRPLLLAFQVSVQSATPRPKASIKTCRRVASGRPDFFTRSGKSCG